VFVKLIPWLEARNGMHRVEPRKIFGITVRKVPDHKWHWFSSYLLWGAAFIALFGSLALLITDKGWLEYHTAWQTFLFARAGVDVLNGAHLPDFLGIPAIGLFVAWKYRGKELLNVYQGLLVCAAIIAIHESLWTGEFYLFYWRDFSWATADNVIKDAFFFVMLGLFLLAYQRYPFQKIPLRTYLYPVVAYVGFLIYWGHEGFTISTINNAVFGTGPYMITQWWGDPLTNALEIGSWLLLEFGFLVVIWRK
jgi:hypothetical protein